jgi:hypothetical protein
MELKSVDINILWFKDTPGGADDARIAVDGARRCR